MPRGRPKLMQKENFHTHEGYARWHPIDQVHSDSTFHKSIGLIHDIVPQETLSEAKEEFEDYSDIYKVLTDIEKGIINKIKRRIIYDNRNARAGNRHLERI